MNTTLVESTAYARAKAKPIDRLTQVGPGTPMGELMRRYWQPLLAVKSVTNLPRDVRILGEDLVIFRDKAGRPGLLYPRCMHRGTSLFYGRVEERGIRCCYHGWLFDVEGNCLEQPCEPNLGEHRAQHRQPWYPVRERYGVVWAYMGPPDKMPLLPKWSTLEDIQPNEYLDVRDNSINSHGDTRGPEVVPYNWLHMNDNIMDPFHVQQLHTNVSGAQFVKDFSILPVVEFEYIDNGVIYRAYRKLPDGREVDRISTWMMPHAMSVPNVQNESGLSTRMAFTVPVDDTHSRMINIAREVPGVDSRAGLGQKQMKRWTEMTIEERQLQPGDYEAQAGQGPRSLHSEEHLVTSDKGIAMQRRMLEQQMKIVEQGGDPAGIAFDEANALIRVPSGNFFRN